MGGGGKADRWAQLSVLWVMVRSKSDFDGTQSGSRRNFVTYRRASVRWCNSKWRKYFWTTLGIVMRRAAAKF